MRNQSFQSTGLTIWILEYSHKHGIDINVYKTQADVERAALEIVAQYRDDFNIASDLSDAEVLANWSELTHDLESIWYYSQDVLHQAS